MSYVLFTSSFTFNNRSFYLPETLQLLLLFQASSMYSKCKSINPLPPRHAAVVSTVAQWSYLAAYHRQTCDSEHPQFTYVVPQAVETKKSRIRQKRHVNAWNVTYSYYLSSPSCNTSSLRSGVELSDVIAAFGNLSHQREKFLEGGAHQGSKHQSTTA